MQSVLYDVLREAMQLSYWMECEALEGRIKFNTCLSTMLSQTI